MTAERDVEEAKALYFGRLFNRHYVYEWNNECVQAIATALAAREKAVREGIAAECDESARKWREVAGSGGGESALKSRQMAAHWDSLAQAIRAGGGK